MYHNVLHVFHDVLLCFTCVSWCFTMFNNVLWCLASRATIGVRANAAGMGDNSAEIGDNSAEIGDDAAGIVFTPLACESDHMLNSVLNGDWSNSVPGREIPDLLVRNLSDLTQTDCSIISVHTLLCSETLVSDICRSGLFIIFSSLNYLLLPYVIHYFSFMFYIFIIWSIHVINYSFVISFQSKRIHFKNAKILKLVDLYES